MASGTGVMAVQMDSGGHEGYLRYNQFEGGGT